MASSSYFNYWSPYPFIYHLTILVLLLIMFYWIKLKSMVENYFIDLSNNLLSPFNFYLI